jgi:hypothetical protein
MYIHTLVAFASCVLKDKNTHSLFTHFDIVKHRPNCSNAVFSKDFRVTKFGEKWLFALGSYMTITEVAHILGLLYSAFKFMH